MDANGAAKYAAEFGDTVVAGFLVKNLIDHGKSAAVFSALAQDGSHVALKLFDRDLVARTGDAQQLKRVTLEKRLGESPHPNIVRVYDSGFDPARDVFFVAMELIDAETLEQRIRRTHAPLAPAIGLYVIRQLLGAAHYLESLELAHRDIKPSNIAVRSDGSITLLDLGVLRGIGDPNGTDAAGHREFVGTLRYSPPEFLLRQEKDDQDGWRAITLYQIAAVGHDIVTGQPLFGEAEPYGKLVDAVLRSPVEIRPSEYPSVFVNLLRAALSKNPATRLQFANYDQWSAALAWDDASTTARDRIRARLQSRAAAETAAIEIFERTDVTLAVVADAVASIVASLPASELPRCKVYCPGEGVVRAEFGDLEKFGLGSSFEIDFIVAVVSALERLIKIDATARQLLHDELKEFRARQSYVGLYDRDAIRGWLEDTTADFVDQTAA